MPSPFSGMDPFIEGQRWTDFHYRLITALGDALVPHVVPRYDIRVEERVYLEPVSEERPEFVRRDVAVLERETGERPSVGAIATRTATAIESAILTLPMPESHREVYLVVRDLETMAVVTVIEVLSPSNKERGSSTYADVTLDLQSVFTTVFDRSGYGRLLDYRRVVVPPVNAEEADWVQERLGDATP